MQPISPTALPRRFATIVFILLIVSFSAFAQTGPDTCTIAKSPGIRFAGSGILLSTTARNTLTAMAKKLKAAPYCKLAVRSHGANSYKTQQLGWDRTMTVIEYLYSKGIPEDQLVFQYGYEGDPNLVELITSMEDGPPTVPPPFPGLSKRLKPKPKSK